MPNKKTILGSKAASLISIAFVFTLVMTAIIRNAAEDFSFSSFIPTLKKKMPARSDSAPSNSFFQSLFAKKGDREIYKIQKDDRWAVIIDGQESALFDSIDNPTFSADGTQFAYSATLDGEEFVIVENQAPQKSYFDILQILFSADGSALAYLADTGNGNLVVVNGMEGKLYQDIGTLETESGITFLVFTSENQIVYRPIEGQQTFIVINTAEGQKYAEIKAIYLNSDGSQVAYYAQDGDNLITVVNGQVTNTQPIAPADSNTPSSNTNTDADSGADTADTPANNANNNNSNFAPTNTTRLRAKDPNRNLSPDIDKQSGLDTLICGQTTDCNF